MAATFDPSLPQTRDVIRLALGDVAAPYDLTNEFIDGVLSKAEALAGSDEDLLAAAPVKAAVQLSELLSTTYAKKAIDVMQGSVRRMYIDRSKHYATLAARIKTQGLPFADSVPDTPLPIVVTQLDAPEIPSYYDPIN